MNVEEAGDTGSLDLAITFFCSVLVLFVFIAFSIVQEEPRENTETIAQRILSQEMNSLGWNAVRHRGDFAVFREGTLTVLNMSAVAQGLAVPEEAYNGTAGEALFATSSRYKTVPTASNLQLFFDKDAPPEQWVFARVDLGKEFACPERLRPQLTVMLFREEADLAPLTRFSRTCDVRMRFGSIKEPADGELAKLVLVLSPAQFRSQSVFR